MFSRTLIPSTKLMKPVVSLRYDFGCCAIGWSTLSTNADNLSVGLETPETMGLPTGVGLCILEFEADFVFDKAIFWSFGRYVVLGKL